MRNYISKRTLGKNLNINPAKIHRTKDQSPSYWPRLKDAWAGGQVVKSRCVILALALAGALSGCDRSGAKPAQSASAAGPWTVVPATAGPYAGANRNNSALFSAWRINTVTGSLEFCTYDPGGNVVGTALTKEKLLCTAPVKPLEIDN
jgi:hypothetical protein